MQAATFARSSLPALVIAVTALGLTACGGSSGDEDAVKKTVNGVYDALAAKDAGKVCDSLSEAGKRQITRGAAGKGKNASCERLFAVGLSVAGEALKDAGDAKVTKVDVNGDKATATVDFRKQSGKVGLVKEGGKWKLNDLSVK